MNQGNEYDAMAVMPEILASGLLDSLCTITTPPGVFDDGGAPVATAPWIPLAGHVDIPCMDAPAGGGEKKTISEVQATDLHKILLGGYFPAVVPKFRAVVDGVQYDILNAQADSQRQMTHLVAQVVTI